ncbi:MAG: dihydroneopterin aldolase [Phycisphaerae bacterium]
MTDPRGATDRIVIRDLRFRCIIGVNPDERREKQDVVVNVELLADLRDASTSDDMADTIDYSRVKKQIVAMGEQSDCMLVERLAQKVSDICLADERVVEAKVLVEKPSALRFARSVGVEIVRRRR